MPPRQSSTADLPARLDALDDTIHELLIRRAQLAPATTPAQQAAILRRLAARHRGNLALPMLVRIWREMMAASAASQLAVHVYSAVRAGVFRDLARGLFGSMAAMGVHPSTSSIMHECTNNADAFGIVPLPESDKNARAWWARLTTSGQKRPRIFATLPLVGDERPSAYVIGTLEPEQGGNDTRLILLEAGENLSLTKLQSRLKHGALESRLLAVSRDSASSASRQHLLDITGFVRDDDARLGTPLEQAGDAILRIASVGRCSNLLRTERAV